MKLAPKHETNDEFVQRVMNFGCPTGALIQAFIIQAMTTYSNMVIHAGPAACESPLLSGEAWVGTANWLKQQLDSKYGH